MAPTLHLVTLASLGGNFLQGTNLRIPMLLLAGLAVLIIALVAVAMRWGGRTSRRPHGMTEHGDGDSLCPMADGDPLRWFSPAAMGDAGHDGGHGGDGGDGGGGGGD